MKKKIQQLLEKTQTEINHYKDSIENLKKRFKENPNNFVILQNKWMNQGKVEVLELLKIDLEILLNN